VLSSQLEGFLGDVAERPSSLTPQGPAAETLTWLWWVMFWLAAAVFVLVVVLLAWSLLGRRDLPLDADRLTGESLAGGSNWLILGGGVALPTVVTVLLMVLMVTSGAELRALGNPSEPLVVEVTGYQFWWDVRYPDAEVRTGNEIQIPAGEPVEFHVTSADVVHSFWVPQLGGKIDMTPGETNTLRLQAHEPGVYRGICTEYCGIQHAHMHFMVVALPPEDFDAWLAARSGPPDEPADALAQQGREVFESAQCVYCHTVDGLSPEVDLGPDLTHFGSRRTIAAGMVPNDPDNLADWILDPQAIKPGNHMPPTDLAAEDLDALIAYLESLE
jgi:cytochrome c oxidase subunit II